MTFVFDENLSKNLSEGLQKLENGNTRSAHRVKVLYAPDLCGEGADDEVIIPKVGAIDAIFITQDRDFTNKKHYFSLYKQHQAAIIVYRLENKAIYWDKVKSFVRLWEDIKHTSHTHKRPFVFIIGKTGGIRRFEF
jgi:hypothetical protein